VTIDCSHMQFRDDKALVDLGQLKNLFNLTAFWANDRAIEDLETAIHYSDPVITVWNGEHLIGHARATSDGIYRAAIWDVIVHPDYQGAGLGRKLVETVIAHPRVNRVERVYLMTTNQQKFYERIGFEENPTTTMLLLNRYPSESLPIRAIEVESNRSV
jgi:ribosomal protein S18 acetylase RimI-like enzyme